MIYPHLRLTIARSLPIGDDEPVPGQLGDSNGDGLVDLLDAECYAKSGTDCGFGVPGADINGDGMIDLLDLYAKRKD